MWTRLMRMMRNTRVLGGVLGDSSPPFSSNGWDESSVELLGIWSRGPSIS